MKLELSVIIPTYNDNYRLQKCLDALSAQTIPASAFEVIIVNNSDKPLSIRIPGDNFFIISESKPGSYAARNAGIRRASGKILAFTDSDCIPEANWLALGIESLQKSGVPRLAGRIKIFANKSRMTPAECYEKIFAFDQIRNVQGGTGVTANLFVERGIFDVIGLFKEDVYSGEDTRWGKRATAAGIGISYEGAAVVSHPARQSWEEIAKKLARTTGGKYLSNQNYRLNAVKSFSPPLSAALTILKSQESVRTMLLAFFVAYRIKIERFRLLSSLKRGLITPQRS